MNELERLREHIRLEGIENMGFGQSKQIEFYSNFLRTKDHNLVKEYEEIIKGNQGIIDKYRVEIIKRLGHEMYGEGELVYLFGERGNENHVAKQISEYSLSRTYKNIHIGFIYRFNNAFQNFYEVDLIKLSTLKKLEDFNTLKIVGRYVKQQTPLLDMKNHKKDETLKIVMKKNAEALEVIKNVFDEITNHIDCTFLKSYSYIEGKHFTEDGKAINKMRYVLIDKSTGKDVRHKTGFFPIYDLKEKYRKGLLQIFAFDEIQKMEGYRMIKDNVDRVVQLERCFNNIFKTESSKRGEYTLKPVEVEDGTYKYDFRYSTKLENGDRYYTDYYSLDNLLIALEDGSLRELAMRERDINPNFTAIYKYRDVMKVRTANTNNSKSGVKSIFTGDEFLIQFRYLDTEKKVVELKPVSIKELLREIKMS